MSFNTYEWADNLINASPRYATGFTMLLPAKPYRVSPAAWRDYASRFALIRSYQKTALEIFRAALKDEMAPSVLHWLINETPECVGIRYHRSLEDRHFTLPVFFRTDEVLPGRITEIQCPGSSWGEFQVVFEHAARMGFCADDTSPADHFVAQLTGLLKETPIVHHALDHASAPPGMRYFIEKTRPAARYWSIDRGVKVSDCNFVRHHSFFSLCADYEFRARLAKAGHGVTYDFPPYVLFDQKAALVLPFWSMTREMFSDEIRDLFPFTTPLLPAGIELPHGALVTVEEFSRFPQSQRSYYLKYAGVDIALNWGSKAVYRLSNLGSGACLDLLRQCVSGYATGQIWLLQKEEAQHDDITYLARDGTVQTDHRRAKFSGYYGPSGFLGAAAWHRRHFKVHGQDDTVLSCVLADGDYSVTA